MKTVSIGGLFCFCFLTFSEYREGRKQTDKFADSNGEKIELYSIILWCPHDQKRPRGHKEGDLGSQVKRFVGCVYKAKK